MEKVGEYLKRERELRGITLKQISEVSRIGMPILTALEQGDMTALPHETFVKGFIHAYCAHLGLDDTEALLRFEGYLRDRLSEEKKKGGSRKAKEDERVEPEQYLKSSNYSAIVLVVLGVIVIGLYYALTPRQVAEVTVPEAKPEVEVGVSVDTAEVPSSVDGIDLEAVIKEGAEEGAQDTGEKPPVEDVVEAEAEEAPREEPLKVVEKKPIRYVLDIRAREETWVQVEIDPPGDPGTGVIKEALLKKGELVRWYGAEVFFCS